MDPISIVAATSGTADVTFRLGRFIKRTIEAAREVDRDLVHLLGQVENLSSINSGITSITCAFDFVQTFQSSFRDIGSLAKPWQDLWRDTTRISKENNRLLLKLETVLKEIQGLDAANDNLAGRPVEKNLAVAPGEGRGGAFRGLRHSASSKIESIRTQIRRDSKSEIIKDISLQLDLSQGALETCLSMINLGWSVQSHQMTCDLLKESKAEFAGFMTRLQDQVKSVPPTANSMLQFSNQIFQAPPASNFFTGRIPLLKQVEEAFGLVTRPFSDDAGLNSPDKVTLNLLSPSTGIPSDHSISTGNIERSHNRWTQQPQRKQKRFILVGLGGSGKTEFCRKFAEQNQSSFWGVFWIDGTSDETAQYSYNEIARIGGVNENIKAAMTWLASLTYPWLLVIDNADDPNLEVEKYFPGGGRGHILVTTRRPALKRLGNVGEGFCELEKLDEVEARDLLLKYAQEKTPWDERAQYLAKQIAEVLGYLPLALVCAGIAIAQGITTLGEYVSWFNDNWEQIRLRSKKSGRVIDEAGKTVFATYEAMLKALAEEESKSAQDAVELLKTLSLLHHENVSMDIMVKAANNPLSVENRRRQQMDEEEQKQLAAKGMKIVTKPKHWQQRLKDKLFQALSWYEERVLYPTLPSVLRNDEQRPFSIHRLRAAMARLTQKSLILSRRKNGTDVYSMHPLIHRWVRERPEMSLGERALWCQAAVTILNQCIPLPPLDGEDSDITFRRQLLPHLDAVRKYQKELQLGLWKMQEQRILPSLFLLGTPSIDRVKANQYARFSRLYSEAGRFHDAEELQVHVKDYAIAVLGLEDERTILIMLALSGTYWVLSRVNEAAVLLTQALRICEHSLGPEHHRTLKVMDELGASECYRGRYEEARKLHEDALAGMQKILPAGHQDIYLAMANLGEVWHYNLEYRKAETFGTQALAGLSEALGKDHPDTLKAKEKLAMTCLDKTLDFGHEISSEEALEKDPESVQKAYILEHEVLEARRRNLGREHNLTLWSVCNLARIKCSLGHLEEAEADLRFALEAGSRNLGEDHLGVLSGKTHLARVIAAQKRYDEAETMFQKVIAKDSYEKALQSGFESPNHLLAVWYYSGFCRLSGRLHKAIGLLEELSGVLAAIETKNPFWQRVEKKLSELKMEAAAVEAQPNGTYYQESAKDEAGTQQTTEALLDK